MSNLNKKRKKLSEEIKEKGLRTTVEEKIVSSQEKLNAKLMAVPILRTKDKVSFVLGIILLMLSEFVVISLPQWMWLYYVMMLIPLMVNRFVSYHRSNAHYFMLDFCYYMQVWALIVIFVYPNDISLFKVFFGLCNGPLLMAVIIWENKMVFHDLDKITSLFIHVFPPLLSYTMRWYTNVENTTDVPITFYDMFCMVLFYVFWQFLYVLKTEWLDAEKFAKDTSLMSSARWLSSVQPHPIYKKMMKLTSNKATATQILVGVQLFYTIIAILPVNLMFNYHSFHLLSILVAIGFSSWYGASFYFESFTMNYTKRLEQKINKFYKNNKESIEGTRKPKKALPSSLQSFISFLKYFSLSLITLIGLMNLLILS
uniref:Glycerophosphocholine acyltransferase 1 n=1 Tax=Arcella intermedia TaxID=1963864 RepID=A0A6B2L5R4_9EUKA